MKDKWRLQGSPQTRIQKSCVIKMFKPLYFSRAYKMGKNSYGFSNSSFHNVNIPGIGIFLTSEAAFQAYKDIENEEYVRKQMNSIPRVSKLLGKKCKLSEDWYEIREDKMYSILKYKFDQHPDLKKNLLKTNLRIIIYHNTSDPFWGDGENNTGENRLGILLMELRKFYLMT